MTEEKKIRIFLPSIVTCCLPKWQSITIIMMKKLKCITFWFTVLSMKVVTICASSSCVVRITPISTKCPFITLFWFLKINFCVRKLVFCFSSLIFNHQCKIHFYIVVRLWLLNRTNMIFIHSDNLELVSKVIIKN